MKGFGAALLVIALVAVGCSSGADESTTTGAGNVTTSTAGGATTTTAATATTTTVSSDGAVSISNFSFNPGDLTVAVGTTVTFTNDDNPSHTSSSDDDVWDSGTIASGDTFMVTFDEPGVYPYHCNIHQTMHGTITVE